MWRSGKFFGASLLILALAGCATGQWEIIVENRSDVPCSFVIKMVGSYSNVVGLPLYETVSLLSGEGFPIHFGWLNS